MIDLKQARSDLGFTQKQMAGVLNTPLKTYIKWEHGDRRVPGVTKAVLYLVGKYKTAATALLAEYT